LLLSGAIEAPLTGGWLRPAVLLPEIAESWTVERRRVVLQHELVHVVRGDGLRRLAWRLVAALYWFHPLARIAEREAGLAGEEACDEAVVRLGTQPSLYARHLLEIAEALRGRPSVFASALPMVERNQLERRVVMILDVDRSRRGRSVAIASVAILTATIACAAAAAPAQRERKPASPDASQDDSSGTVHNESFQHDFGDGCRLSARIVGYVQFDERTGAIREMPRGSSVVIETRELGKGSQRMRVTEEEGEPRYEWWVNGDSLPVDADARAWLKEAREVFAAYRAIGSIRGHVGSLQGQIGSIQGQIGSLQGRIGSILGEEGSLRGKIGSIQGERGSLDGQIGSHQGAIGSLEAARAAASDDLRKRIDREIRAHEAAIEKLEAERDDGALARRLAEAEAELRAFQRSSRGKIADLERQIAAIRSENEVERLEQEIEDFHAEERVDEIERRVARAIERLEVLIRKLGS
jgi:predicted  nucleic acid-binding Zn-ribbon protein